MEERARQLRRQLLDPAAPELAGAREIVLEASGPLETVPFALLYQGEAPLVRAGSLSEYLDRLSTAKLSPRKALIVSLPAVAPSLLRLFPVLEEAEREAADARALLRQAVVVSGKQATPTAVRAAAAGSDIFHSSGHATTGPGSSALLLTPEREDAPYSGLWSASAIAGQDWRSCELVVLSACSTARSGEARGVPRSLVQAFLVAGARRVIASAWDVDASVTRRLMASFYEDLARHGEPARALQRAIALVRQHAASSHPYYWAAFQIYGFQ